MGVKGRSLPGSPLNCIADNSKSSRDPERVGQAQKGLGTELLKFRHRREAKTKGPRDASRNGAPSINTPLGRKSNATTAAPA